MNLKALLIKHEMNVIRLSSVTDVWSELVTKASWKITGQRMLHFSYIRYLLEVGKSHLLEMATSLLTIHGT